MIDLQPVRIALAHAQEVDIQADGWRFYARMWNTSIGWLGYAVYYIGDDVQIHRNSPGLGMSDIDCATWVQTAFTEGPRFLLPLLETPT